MLINFPNQLTSEEEQLLKKIAKMKKKKKLFIEKKAQLKESQNEIQQNTTSSLTTTTTTPAKRSSGSSGIGGGNNKKEIDAKEAAKKLIQSGAIKFETENKSKGFKRSSSRKDDIKKTQLTSQTSQDSQNFGNNNQQITYSNKSPSFTKSPTTFPSPNYGYNKFNYSTDNNQFDQSPGRYNKPQGYRRFNSYNQSGNGLEQGGGPGPAQGPTPGNGMPNIRIQKKPYQNFNNNNYNTNNQKDGVSLFVKANNVTEELLRSIFSANVSQVKILSIDVKTNFAFVNVDTKEAADIAITELNGKTFNENLFSVSVARPRKTFQRNNTYNSNYNDNNRNNTYNNNTNSMMTNNNNGYNNYSSNNTFNNNSNNNTNFSNNVNYSSANSSENNSPNPNIQSQQNESTSSNRQIINYEDI